MTVKLGKTIGSCIGNAKRSRPPRPAIDMLDPLKTAATPTDLVRWLDEPLGPIEEETNSISDQAIDRGHDQHHWQKKKSARTPINTASKKADHSMTKPGPASKSYAIRVAAPKVLSTIWATSQGLQQP